ncbi:MAG: hypothetical protein A3F70_13995 [Acidobacteria bacterium RIFCSPLOWO2_12_FULL_67_14]|nr:MAG: hypothetical protein A3H29_03165 [Acidobacteria bacterium RIFCSPLOWO2_02_FULL_67_21]OFW37692.1 MAG: hypothetical protein A3F70_13995 [Acidobacteria bacterium RIFCSPLOWO2_12_FULL_67_14]
MAVLTRASLCLVALLVMAGCRTGPEQWGSFRGRVVDAETEKPIAGAHVMVMWVRERPALHLTESFFDAQETVTDLDGRFEIPRQRRILTAWVTGPAVSVFAPGYLMLEPKVTPPGGLAYVDPTVVRMRPLTTLEERCRFRPREPFGPTTAVPRYLTAVQAYNLRLECFGLLGT